MSKKCPWCEVDVYLTEIKHWWRCPKCQTEFPERAFPKESTLFDHIKQSPEVMAKFLVFHNRIYKGRTKYHSAVVGGEFDTKEEAIAATLEKLKEVYDE